MNINRNHWRDIAIGIGIGILSTALGGWNWIYSIIGGSFRIFILIICIISLLGALIGGNKIQKWWGAIVGIAVSFVIVHLLIFGVLIFTQS